MQFIARLAVGLSIALLTSACAKDRASPPMAAPGSTAPTAPGGAPTVISGSYTVSGVVSEGPSPSDRIIAGANISAWIDQGMSGYSYMWAHGAVLTDSSGRYQLRGLPDGVTAWVQAWKDGYVQQCAAPLVTVHGDTAVDVQLVSKANLSAASAPLPGAPGFRAVTGVILENTAAGPRPVAGAFVDFEPTMDFPAAVTYSDTAGRYLLCGLPEASTVSLGASLGIQRVAWVSVPPGKNSGVDITLPP